jgi:hypothetical protein
LEAKELEITCGGIEIIFFVIEQNVPIISNNKTKKTKVLFLKIILNSKDNKTLGNLIGKFYKDGTVWIIVPVKKIYNYMSRAKVIELIELKVKGEPVIDSELNNLLVSGVNNIMVIIKKKL